MVITMSLCTAFGVVAWFIGCMMVMWQKYHKVREFLKLKTLFTKKKVMALLIYLAIGAGAGAVFYTYGWLSTKILKYLILIYAALLIAYIDWITHLIPNVILLVMMGIRMILLFAELIIYDTARMEILANAFGGMIIGFLIFIIAYFVSRKGIGLGDVKLVAVIGFYTGTSVLYAIMILALLCCVVYSVIQLIRRKLTTKDFIAFGPFVAVGTVVALFLGV